MDFGGSWSAGGCASPRAHPSIQSYDAQGGRVGAWAGAKRSDAPTEQRIDA